MFGHKKLLTEGAQGQGVITNLRVAYSAEGHNLVYGFDISFRFRFEDGSAVEDRFEAKAWDWRHEFPDSDFPNLEDLLQSGEPVPVRYDPADHSKVVLDVPALKAVLLPKLKARSDQATADREATVVRGESRLSGGAEGSTPLDLPGGGSLADILQQATRDPEGLRARLQAQGSGASAFVVTDAGVAPLGGTPVGQQTDVADQLTKLADLRDRGVLTDAEFDAQKQKLLGT
jgi:hypothetical protein